MAAQDKAAAYNMRLPASLKKQFLAAAKRNDRDGSQLIRDFMREYIEQSKKPTLSGQE